MYSKHKQLEYDIQTFLKNPKTFEEIDQRNFFDKYFVIIFLPFILSIVLFLFLLLIGFNKYMPAIYILPMLYLIFLYFCLVEYLSFIQLFKNYPEFAYVYFLAKNDKEKKKDFSYDKAVQKLYNQLTKHKIIAKKRLKYKFLIGLPTYITILMMIILGCPEASLVIIAVSVIYLFYFLIEVIMRFGGKGE